MEQPPLPTKFLIRNINYIPVKEFVEGNYYFLEEVVIEMYCQYDYLLQVVEKTDTSITFKKLNFRFNSDMMEPGTWEEDGEQQSYTIKEIERGYTENENEIRFYKVA